MKVQNAQAAVTPEEETRVKALGFLRDKTTADKFNGRVITRNGKITAERDQDQLQKQQSGLEAEK